MQKYKLCHTDKHILKYFNSGLDDFNYGYVFLYSLKV